MRWGMAYVRILVDCEVDAIKYAAAKMQKGGMVPCKGCKNPAACKKAGTCLAKSW